MLATLLSQHRGPLVADFYRYAGDSPARLAARGVPLRDIADIAVNLPPDSAIGRALNPPDQDSVWDLHAHLGALSADLLAWVLYVLLRQAGSRAERPTPIQRPGVGPTRERVEADTFASPEDFISWYEAQPGGRKIATA